MMEGSGLWLAKAPIPSCHPAGGCLPTGAR